MEDLIVDVDKNGLEMKKKIVQRHKLGLDVQLIRVREKMGERLGRVYDVS